MSLIFGKSYFLATLLLVEEPAFSRLNDLDTHTKLTIVSGALFSLILWGVYWTFERVRKWKAVRAEVPRELFDDELYRQFLERQRIEELQGTSDYNFRCCNNYIRISRC